MAVKKNKMGSIRDFHRGLVWAAISRNAEESAKRTDNKILTCSEGRHPSSKVFSQEATESFFSMDSSRRKADKIVKDRQLRALALGVASKIRTSSISRASVQRK